MRIIKKQTKIYCLAIYFPLNKCPTRYKIQSYN